MPTLGTTSGTGEASEAKRAQVDVTGMECASCVGRIERALCKLDGVRAVALNLATGRATITWQAPVTLPQLVESIRHAGYEPTVARLDLPISGLDMSLRLQTEATLRAISATAGRSRKRLPLVEP